VTSDHSAIAFHVPEFRIEPLPRPELRKDPIIDRWVIISTDRLGRPVEFFEDPPIVPLANCPFCRGQEHLTPPATYAYPEGEAWRVRVVPNTFPAVRGEASGPAPLDGLFRTVAASGIHEVVVACPHHEANFACLPADQWAIVFTAFQHRLRYVKDLGSPQYPVIFANQGSAAGASLEHPHAQLITLPTPPELMAREWQACQQYFRLSRRCIYCDLLAAERADRSRLVFESEHLVVISAYAARCPAECWIFPKQHQGHFEDVDTNGINELGEVFSLLLRKLDRGLRSPPLNFYLHAAAPRKSLDEEMHWHIEVLPRLTGIAGFEWGAGMNINPVPPEQAAAYLRAITP
jgi:UDPglucose--hexose-1-phosphate uridylyltransferase